MKQGRWSLWAAGVLVFAPAVLFGETTVFYSGAGDGTCGNGGGSLTWAQWRSLSASQAVNYTGTDTSGASSAFEPSVYINGNGKYSGGRAFIPFDTSALPDDAVVTSASVVLTPAAKWRTGAAANNAVKITGS